MWSIGTITALLLTGEHIFGDRGDMVNSQFQLDSLDHESVAAGINKIDDPRRSSWVCLSSRARSFVKALLVLDEARRLRAPEALQHSWFTHPAYVAELEEVYRHAISEWTPSSQHGDVHRVIDTTCLGASPFSSPFDASVPDKKTVSRFFDANTTMPLAVPDDNGEMDF